MEFIENSQFGTPEYQAESDYFDLEGLYNLLETDADNAIGGKDPNATFFFESHLRITELKIALLENEIRHKQSRLEGYSKVYLKLDTGFEELAGTAFDEAKALFPNDEESRGSYFFSNYDLVYERSKNLVYRKRE